MSMGINTETAALSLTVVIPVYHPGKQFLDLMKGLAKQHVLPDRVILVQTISDKGEKQREKDQRVLSEAVELLPAAEVVQIPKEDFDHGGTRDMAARMADTDLVMFMTMDAVPDDRELIGKMKEGFADERTACVCGRQLPAADAGEIERYTRSFNYPEQSRQKSLEDLKTLGIKTFFCSDVCAAYRRDRYLELGGFVHPAIFNEDMIFAGTAVLAGYSVFYQAEARVIHSHNYTGLQQFHRNFDLGVSQADHPEIFSVAASESEGIRMIKKNAVYLLKRGKAFLIPKLIWQSGWKFVGYRMGKMYRRLPGWMISKCTMNRSYWKLAEKNKQETI